MRTSYLLFIASSWITYVLGAPVTTRTASNDLSRSEVHESKSLLQIALQNSSKIPDLEGPVLLSRRSTRRSKKRANIPYHSKHDHYSGFKRKQGSLSAPPPTGVCTRHIGRRDLFRRVSGSSGSASSDCSDEFAKKDIPLTLKTTSTEEQVTETIKKGSRNLGHGNGAANNAGVYRLEKWGNIPGPLIAKKFHDERDMKREAGNLRKADHLIASGDSHGPWAVMHFVPGSPLGKTKEYENALKSSKEECESFMRKRHREFISTVDGLYTKTKMLHADLKEENVHWTFDSNGEGKAHLLDFGQMRHNPTSGDNIYKLVTAGNEKTPLGYAKSRAEKLFPLSKCPDH